jgi:hypothetical protein
MNTKEILNALDDLEKSHQAARQTARDRIIKDYLALKSSHNELKKTMKLLNKMRHIHKNEYTKRIVEQALKEAGEL